MVALLDSLFPYVRIGVEINGHTVRVILVDYVCASADDNTGFLLRDILYKTDISFTRIFGTVAHDKTVKKTVDRFLVQKICVFIIDVSSFRLFDKSFFVKNLHTQFFGQNVGDFVPAASTLSCDCYFHAY